MQTMGERRSAGLVCRANKKPGLTAADAEF